LNTPHLTLSFVLAPEVSDPGSEIYPDAMHEAGGDTAVLFVPE
jgi:hypothetical protein